MELSPLVFDCVFSTWKVGALPAPMLETAFAFSALETVLPPACAFSALPDTLMLVPDTLVPLAGTGGAIPTVICSEEPPIVAETAVPVLDWLLWTVPFPDSALWASSVSALLAKLTLAFEITLLPATVSEPFVTLSRLAPIRPGIALEVTFAVPAWLFSTENAVPVPDCEPVTDVP